MNKTQAAEKQWSSLSQTEKDEFNREKPSALKPNHQIPEGNPAAALFGLAVVRKSIDFEHWPRWVVIFPDSTPSKWFKTEDAAEKEKRQFNAGKCFQ
jgi:hypothetical protein